MLEKLAELVREQGIIESSLYNEEEKRVYVYTTIPLESPVTINADVSNPVSAEYKLARWAVLLVAKGLEKLPDAKAEDLKGLVGEDGKPRAKYLCAMSNLGINLMNLLSEAVISARAAAKEGANG